MQRSRKETTQNENKEPVKTYLELTQMVEWPEKNIRSYYNCVTYIQIGKERVKEDRKWTSKDENYCVRDKQIQWD